MKAFEDESLLLPNRLRIFWCFISRDTAVHSGDSKSLAMGERETGLAWPRLSAARPNSACGICVWPRAEQCGLAPGAGWWLSIMGKRAAALPFLLGEWLMSLAASALSYTNMLCSSVCSFHLYFQQRYYYWLLQEKSFLPLVSVIY